MPIIHTTIPHLKDNTLQSLCGFFDGDWDEVEKIFIFYYNGCSIELGRGIMEEKGYVNLPVLLKEDGSWLLIEPSDAKPAIIKLEDIFKDKSPLIKGAFTAWSAEQRERSTD